VFKRDSARRVEPSQPALTHIDILIDHDVNTRGTIQGQILTSDNKAAQGIWVYAFSEIIGSGNGAFTDQNGVYTITSLTTVSDTDPYTMGYIVAVHSVQDNHQNNNSMLWYTYQAYPGITDKTLAQRVKTGATHINFILKTDCAISGSVKDIYGSIIPGAEVQVRSDKTGGLVSAVTDQNGMYFISGLSPVDDYIITASAVYFPIMYYNGKSTHAFADKVDLTDGDVTDINFALDTGYIIEGLVFIDNAEKKASSGLWVNIWSESTRTGGDVPTDSNGRYQMTGLYPNVTDYFITIRKQDYMAAYYRDNNDSDLMNDTVYTIEDATGISATPLELAVDRNLIIRAGLCVSGIVQYKGIPVSGIRVEAWSEATGGWDVDISKGTLTNGANYKISGLPPGEYHVNVYPLNYQDDYYRVELTNSDIQNLHFPLKDLKNMICGTVYGLKNGKKAQISAWSEGTGFNKTIVLTGTGDDMPYTISQVKPSSDYRVQFSGFDYPLQVYNNHTSVDEADLIHVTEDVVSGIDFVVYSGTKTISGTVTFPDSAVSGDMAWIDAFSQSTGSDGAAQVVLLDGNTANYLIKGLKEAPDFTVVAWGKQYQEQYYDQQTDASKATYVNTADNILDTHIDFDLTPGATISGSVFKQGLPVEGLHILALSDKTSFFGGSTSLSDGSYKIDGLDLADDFVIKTQQSGMAPFYYHEVSTTRDENLATRVSTLADHHPSGIDIQMSILESISGTIRDENGKSLSGIWVNVWSDLQQSGEGIYSSEEGIYMINALPKSNDYKVSIGEHAALIYVPEEKTNVKSGTSGVDFTLRKAYHLTGVVSNIEGKPIVKAEVELYSKLENFYVWTKTDGSGIYNIQCIPSGLDYALSIISPKLSSYVPYNEVDLSIVLETTTNNKIQKDIVLKTASFMNGYIYKADKTSPIMNANVSIYSNDLQFSAVWKTDENGYYRINNIPDSNDYEVAVTTENHEKTVKTDQAAGTSVDFILETGGSLSGKVLEQDGAPLADVLVEVQSLSAHFTGVQRTDMNGAFTVNGLPRFLDTGYEINDFVVTIYPKNYAQQSQGQKRVGETLTFVCKQAKITGSITDSNGSPIPDGVVVAVKIYKNLSQGGFVTKTGVESDGTFTIEGLLHNTGYQLEIRIFNSKISENVQWVDQNKNGVVGRTNAGVFMTGSSVDVRLSGSWDD
jgi:protocatechuate 3,4-dioxygenase beta subunit